MCFLQQEDYIQHQATIGDHHKQISGGDLEKEIIVTEIVVHQSYFGDENDIALLELSEKVDLTIYTPACLPSSGENFVGKQATATGILNRSTYKLI